MSFTEGPPCPICLRPTGFGIPEGSNSDHRWCFRSAENCERFTLPQNLIAQLWRARALAVEAEHPRAISLLQAERDSAQREIEAALDVLAPSLRSSGLLDAVKQKMTALLLEIDNAKRGELLLRGVCELMLAARTTRGFEWKNVDALLERGAAGKLEPGDYGVLERWSTQS